MNEVSVIMPAYNAERFIEEAIVSVVNQTYENWKLYIYNDGSTDNTKVIIKRFIPKYPDKIFLIDCIENKGVVFGLNVLLNEARGEYICWLSADDVYTPDMLKDSVGYLDNNFHCDWVFSNYEYIDENSNFLRSVPFRRYREELKEQVSTQPYYTLLTEGCCIHGCTVMMRNYCYKKVGEFNSDYLYAHDYDMWLRMAAEYNVGYIDKIHVKGREYSTQISMQGHNEIDAIKVLLDFICDSDKFSKLYIKAGIKTSEEALFKLICGQLKTYKHMEKECSYLIDNLQYSEKKIIRRFYNNSQNKKIIKIIKSIKDNIWNLDEDFFLDDSPKSYLKLLCNINQSDAFLINRQAIRFENFKGNTLYRFNMGLIRRNDIVCGRVKLFRLKNYLKEYGKNYRFYITSYEKEDIVLATSYYLYKNSDIVQKIKMENIEITNSDIWWELISYLY